VTESQLVVIGVDPGKATGIACFIDRELSWTMELPVDEVAEEIEVYCQHRRERAARDDVELTIIIAVERYTIGLNTVKKTRQTAALEIIGQLERVARELDAVFIRQNASDAKKIGNPALLKRLNWWTYIDHINDAEAHVLAALASKHPTVFAQLIGM
jgi:hypothetical protein